MKNRTFLALALVVLATTPSACSAQDERAGARRSAYDTKSTQGDISFDLTPRVSDEGQLVVELRANTHSGNLADLDLATVVSLVVDGRTYRPVAAGNLGAGHHSAGWVAFDVRPPPSRFAVTIAPVRGMDEQRLDWP